MPDRFTNTVDVLSDGMETTQEDVQACRPTVINNFLGDLSSFTAWWAQWKAFMFEQPLRVLTKKGPATQIPFQMLSK